LRTTKKASAWEPLPDVNFSSTLFKLSEFTRVDFGIDAFDEGRAATSRRKVPLHLLVPSIGEPIF
jgi:hypothetical protein